MTARVTDEEDTSLLECPVGPFRTSSAFVSTSGVSRSSVPAQSILPKTVVVPTYWSSASWPFSRP